MQQPSFSGSIPNPLLNQHTQINPQASKPQDFQKPLSNPTDQSVKYYLISIGLFFVAFLAFVAVWAAERFALGHQVYTTYYAKTYNWAQAMSAYNGLTMVQTTFGIAMGLLLQWITWKAPLVFFTYNCIKLNEGKMKFLVLTVCLAILLGADIALTIFLSDIYNNYMYFGLFSLTTVIAAIICNCSLQRTKQSILDSLLPLLSIGILHGIQVLGLPILYKLYQSNLSSPISILLMIYLFPIVDLLMYCIFLVMGAYVSKEVKVFHQQIHFLMVGYATGYIMLIGYTEVEFYYLVAYFIFRNIFTNYVMFKFQKTLNLPPALPAWGLAYYFSYILLFLPFNGVGNLRVAWGYFSYLTVNTNTLLYSLPNSLYPNTPFTTPTINNFSFNFDGQGNIFWLSGLIIWVGMTFSQKYSMKMPEIAPSIVFNIFGIYLFYLGLSAGLSTSSLISNTLI